MKIDVCQCENNLLGGVGHLAVLQKLTFCRVGIYCHLVISHSTSMKWAAVGLHIILFLL